MVDDKHAQSASAWYKERHIDLELISVMRDGIEEMYKIEPYEGLYVRIGDPNVTISGEHTYEIKYKVAGALAKYDDQVELYWNVTGDKWNLPIEKTVVSVTADDSVLLDSAQYCYVGVAGSKERCLGSNFKEAIDGSKISSAQFFEDEIPSGQQLTIAQAVNIPGEPEVIEYSNPLLFALIGMIGWFSFLSVWIYRWKTKFRISKTVIPQYERYEDFKPMFTGVLIDNKLDPRDISAGIVYLAEQGFISIKQTSNKFLFFDVKDYEVTLLKSKGETESHFHHKLLGLLFGSESVGEKIKLSEISASVTRRMVNAQTVKNLKESVVKELIDKGFLEQRISRTAKIIAPFIIFWLYIFFSGVIVSFLTSFVGNLLIFVLIISVITTIFFTAERRTEKGFGALNHLKGFKDFLSVTGEERFAFHNAPGLSPQQFMEHLPYAIAFGVEKEWAEVFKDIYIGEPVWYSSATGSGFSAPDFSRSLGAFSSSLTASTGASGSSGSGGGGSSGGGSGGGGGGSW